MRHRSSILLFLLFTSIAAFMIGCQDNCVDVVCAPSPPLLQVIVLDTITIDTTVTAADSISDSTFKITVTRPTTDAVVTLFRATGADTVTFDTLTATDESFVENDLAVVSGGTFAIRAERRGRVRIEPKVELQRVEGCCPYSVVGLFRLTVPQR